MFDGWIEALARRGWLLPLVALLAALIVGTYARPVAPIVDPLIGLVRSPAEVRCPQHWVETTGRDPDGQVSLQVCTSPEGRYVITIRQGQAPVGLDTQTGVFLTPEDISWFLQQ